MGLFFNTGSDIPNNYPILIGIKQSDHHILETAGYVARYENRVGSSIPLSAFTHLEVPAIRIHEVTQLLKKYGQEDMPVFAFEQCEVWWSQQHFSKLVSEKLPKSEELKV